MNQRGREASWGLLWAALFSVPAAFLEDALRVYWHNGTIQVGWHRFWTAQQRQLTVMWAGTTLFILLVKQWRRWKDRKAAKAEKPSAIERKATGLTIMDTETGKVRNLKSGDFI